MKHQFKALIHKEDDLWVGQIEEVPGAISQGHTLKELKENLAEALGLILEYQREQLIKDNKHVGQRRETITLNYN